MKAFSGLLMKESTQHKAGKKMSGVKWTGMVNMVSCVKKNKQISNAQLLLI